MFSFKPKFNVELVGTTENAIVFSFVFNGIIPNEKTNIIVNVYRETIRDQQTEFKKAGNLYIENPVKEYYTLEDLMSGTTFRLNFFLTHGGDTYNAVLFANTNTGKDQKKSTRKTGLKQDEEEAKKEHLSITENLLYTYTNMKCSHLGAFKDDKDVKRSILEARHSRKWKDYQTDGYKYAKPKFNRETRKKRMWLVMNGMEVFEDVYGIVNAEKGFRVLEGDWFMGPFYGYNNNMEKKPQAEGGLI